MATSEYQLVTLNVSGVIDTSTRFKFEDDDAALAHARALHHVGRVEVWAGKRQVGIVPATIERRSAATRTRKNDG